MTTRDPGRNGEADALPRDEALSRVYRGQADAAPAGPPAALDAHILAAARRAVTAPRRPARVPLPWWRRLMVPVSVAAVLVVSATLTLMVHDEQQKLEAPAPAAVPQAAPKPAPFPAVPPAPARSSAPTQAPVQSRESDAVQLPKAIRAERNAPAASTLSSEPPAAIAPEAKAKAAKRADESTREMRRIEAAPAVDNAAAKPAPAAEALPRPAPSAFPAAAPVASPAVSAPAPPVDAASGAGATPGAAAGGTAAPAPLRSERESRVRQMREAAPLPTPVAPAAATPPPQGVAAEPATGSQDGWERPAKSEMRRNRDVARSPEAWLEEIRQLKRSGREVEWREALQQFRARYPDYPLPEDLR